MRAPDDAHAALVRSRQAERRLPSVVAATFRDGDLVWADAAGLADVASGEEATVEHQYRIGSITKTFTAAAVLQLRDEGRLDLDDPAARHVEELTHPGPTLRTLLAHTSGLQREPPGDIWDTLEMPTREELLARIGEVERVLHGGWWHYSNMAFVVLGEVVERVSGRPYREHVEERLLGPLGLARTMWSPEPPAATGYLVDPWADVVHEEPPVETDAFTAAGQLWSTVGDLARWGAFLADPDPGVLAPATAEEMRVVHAMAEPERWLRAWGLGLELRRRGDRIWAGHGGAMPGFLASLAFRARERAGAVVLTNSSADAFVDVTCLDLAEQELELRPFVPARWEPAEPVPADVAPLLGTWWSEGHEFSFAWRGGRLEARLRVAPGWVPPAAFEREEADLWRTVSGRERGERLRVVRGEDGSVERLYWATYPFTREPHVFGTDA